MGMLNVLSERNREMIAAALMPNDERGKVKQLNERISKLLRDNAMLKRKLQTGFHFSKDELKAHDIEVMRKARNSYREELRRELTKEHEEWMVQADKEIRETWDEASAEFKSGSFADNFRAWERVVLSVPIKVLVRDIGWKPLTQECCGDNRQNLVKFCNKCCEELENICANENEDLRNYANDVMQMTGAGFVMTEEDA